MRAMQRVPLFDSFDELLGNLDDSIRILCCILLLFFSQWSVAPDAPANVSMLRCQPTHCLRLFQFIQTASKKEARKRGQIQLDFLFSENGLSKLNVTTDLNPIHMKQNIKYLSSDDSQTTQIFQIGKKFCFKRREIAADGLQVRFQIES